jgi:hypothetical protein
MTRFRHRVFPQDTDDVKAKILYKDAFDIKPRDVPIFCYNEHPEIRMSNSFDVKEMYVLGASLLRVHSQGGGEPTWIITTLQEPTTCYLLVTSSRGWYREQLSTTRMTRSLLGLSPCTPDAYPRDRLPHPQPTSLSRNRQFHRGIRERLQKGHLPYSTTCY